MKIFSPSFGVAMGVDMEADDGMAGRCLSKDSF